MKTILVLLTVLFSTQSFAWIQRCDNSFARYGEVSYSYKYCVNNNMNELFSRTRAYSSACYPNFGNYSQHNYVACLNNSFRNLGHRVGAYLPYCSNFQTPNQALSYQFLRCINNNFFRVDRILR